MESNEDPDINAHTRLLMKKPEEIYTGKKRIAPSTNGSSQTDWLHEREIKKNLQMNQSPQYKTKYTKHEIRKSRV